MLYCFNDLAVAAQNISNYLEGEPNSPPEHHVYAFYRRRNASVAHLGNAKSYTEVSLARFQPKLFPERQQRRKAMKLGYLWDDKSNLFDQNMLIFEFSIFILSVYSEHGTIMTVVALQQIYKFIDETSESASNILFPSFVHSFGSFLEFLVPLILFQSVKAQNMN